jgi:hypothetical protein
MNKCVRERKLYRYSVIILLVMMWGSSLFAIDGKMRPHPHTYKSVVITFEPGKFNISETAKKDLEAILQAAKAKGKIKKAKIAVWSDKEMPLQGQHLSKQEMGLARNRSLQIINELKNHGVYFIKTFNMAKPPGHIAQLFGTESAELKSQFDKKESASPLKHQELEAIKEKGAPSKAVINFEIVE